MAREQALQHVPDVLGPVPAIRHLGRLRGALGGRRGKRPGTIPANDADLRVLPEPRGHSRDLAIRQGGDQAVPLQVHDQRRVGSAFAQGELVDTNDAGRRWHREWDAPLEPEQGGGLVGIPQAVRSAAADSLASTKARRRRCAVRRSVRRAPAGTTGASRSAKMLYGHAALAQRKRRTWTRRWTARPAQGKSRIVRW